MQPPDRVAVRKIVVHRPGGYARLCLEDHPDPRPGAGEVLVDVRAAGVNFADCITRMGLYASARRLVGYPVTPGFEIAGTVAATGVGVEGHRLGETVLALTLFGGYATRVAVRGEWAFPIPEGWTPAQAAGFPAAFLTAWYALFELAHPRAGTSVLVHSAAGGVGGALVQLARLAGCRVVGVVGATHKVEAARALGAEAVIDKSRQALWREAQRLAPRGYGVVLDANGATTLKASYHHLAPGGRLVVYGFHSMLSKGRGTPNPLRLLWGRLRTPRFDPLRLTGENRSVLAFNLSLLGDRTDLMRQAMAELLGWAAQGRIRPLATTTYPMHEVTRAHRDLESGRTTGKLVLTMD